jgi:hypothetical protein
MSSTPGQQSWQVSPLSTQVFVPGHSTMHAQVPQLGYSTIHQYHAQIKQQQAGRAFSSQPSNRMNAIIHTIYLKANLAYETDLTRSVFIEVCPFVFFLTIQN